MTEARQHDFAVEQYGAVGGEDEIGQAGRRLDHFDRGAGGGERAAQPRPLPTGQFMQSLPAVGPGLRVHPGIDAVGDREMPRRAHQEARSRILAERRVNVHRGFEPSLCVERLPETNHCAAES